MKIFKIDNKSLNAEKVWVDPSNTKYVNIIQYNTQYPNHICTFPTNLDMPPFAWVIIVIFPDKTFPSVLSCVNMASPGEKFVMSAEAMKWTSVDRIFKQKLIFVT
jgi:hypothetical protein